MYRISPGIVNTLARCGALIAFSLVATTALAADLPALVAAALQRAQIPESAIALYVQDVTQTTPTLSLNAERPMNPASVMKILTTDAALEVLGPAYRWKTELYTDGVVKNQRLNGNLIFKWSSR